ERERGADGADGDLGPQRTHGESVAAAPAARAHERIPDARAEQEREPPARPFPERAEAGPHDAATEHLEVRVDRRDGLALREPEDETTPDEEPAEGHDERGHAAVRDNEALEAADDRAEGEPAQQRDDPGVRLAETEPEILRD